MEVGLILIETSVDGLSDIEFLRFLSILVFLPYLATHVKRLDHILAIQS